MHAKCMLIDFRENPGAGRCSTSGSLNLNRRSRAVNHEAFVTDRDPAIIARLHERWLPIYREYLAHREAG